MVFLKFSDYTNEYDSLKENYLLKYPDFDENDFLLMELENYKSCTKIINSNPMLAFSVLTDPLIYNYENDISLLNNIDDPYVAIGSNIFRENRDKYIEIKTAVVNSKSKEETINYLKNVFRKILEFIEIKQKEISTKNDISSKKNDIFLENESSTNKKNFVKYTSRHIIEPYIDYSYLFQRMLKEGIIIKIKHLEFIDWLFENEFISEKIKDQFITKEGFRSLQKSSSSQRENNFNNVFNL